MAMAEVRRLRALEEEDRKLKHRAAVLSLNEHILQEVMQKVLRVAQLLPRAECLR